MVRSLASAVDGLCYPAAMLSRPDADDVEPSVRFVIWGAVTLLAAYQLGVLLGFLAFPNARFVLLAGPLFLLAPLWLGLSRAARPAALRVRSAPPAAVASAAAATIGLLPAVFVAGSLAPEPDAVEKLLRELLHVGSGPELLVVVAGVSIAPALSEEIFFRGFLQRGLERRFGRWPGILATAAVFGILHGVTRAPLIAALGVLFGWMASRSGSVWPSVAAHALTNGIAIAVVNGPEAALEAAPESAAWTVVAAGGIAAAGLLAVFARSVRPDGSDPSPSAGAPPPDRPVG